MIVFDPQRPINRYNVDNDYNYWEELVESFISESNGGTSVFIACTEPKILKYEPSTAHERRKMDRSKKGSGYRRGGKYSGPFLCWPKELGIQG
jgi:hypothetical protein